MCIALYSSSCIKMPGTGLIKLNSHDLFELPHLYVSYCYSTLGWCGLQSGYNKSNLFTKWANMFAQSKVCWNKFSIFIKLVGVYVCKDYCESWSSDWQCKPDVFIIIIVEQKWCWRESRKELLRVSSGQAPSQSRLWTYLPLRGMYDIVIIVTCAWILQYVRFYN